MKNEIRQEVACIQPELLYSVMEGFVNRLQCITPCGGGHVEYLEM